MKDAFNSDGEWAREFIETHSFASSTRALGINNLKDLIESALKETTVFEMLNVITLVWNDQKAKATEIELHEFYKEFVTKILRGKAMRPEQITLWHILLPDHAATVIEICAGHLTNASLHNLELNLLTHLLSAAGVNANA